MKLKLDENLPVEIAELLRQGGVDTDTVNEEGLRGHRDERVFSAAVAAGRILLTQDLDFSDLRRFRPGTHPGIILVRLGNPARRVLIERLVQVLTPAFIQECAGGFVVVTDRKIRIRKPGPSGLET